MSDLLIKINADAKNAKQAFDDVKKQTEDLQNVLNTAGTAGAVAFAGVTAAAVMSVLEFEKASTAVRELNNVLQNQGIYTDALAAKYKSFADSLEAVTGIEAEQIMNAQGVAQGFLGQMEVTEELTTAITNLAAAKKIDLASAATMVAKSISTEQNALKREGLELDVNATKAEKYARVLEFLDGKYSDAAATANTGFKASLTNLQKQFGDIAENVGQKLQPVLVAVTNIFASMFEVLAGSPVFTDLAIAIGAAIAAIGGILALAPVVAGAFMTMKAAAAAFGVTLNASFLGIPLLIGALVGAITLLALNWNNSVNFMKATFSAFWETIKGLAGSFASILKGIFTLDMSEIQKGLAQGKEAFSKGAQEYREIRAEYTKADAEEQGKQDAQKKAFADKQAAEERAQQARLAQIRREGDQLVLLEMQGASKAQLDLQREEIAILKALNEEKTAIEIEALNNRLGIVRALQEEQRAADLERMIAFEQEKQAMEMELSQSGMALTANIQAEVQAQLQAQMLTELEAEKKLQADLLKVRIEARNQELIERKKFGAAYAIINKAIQSEEVQGAKSAASELLQLQSSTSNELKAIGKAAALAQIAIATAESAMNIYRGFSTIPIIGPALGVAGAAAAVAFGAERTATVIGAADGGLITGGIPGVDSVPAMLQQNELVAPARSFDEVVGGVRMMRNGIDLSPVVEAIERLAVQVSTMRTTTIIGDVMTDDAYVDSFVKKIAEAVDYRNARMPATEVV